MTTKRSTTAILKALRALMVNPKYVTATLSGYIVPSEDAHRSEYTAEHDRRRTFVSSFTGSRGLAVITEQFAALWTDGRYFLQAEKELDENWTLMKEGLKETPTVPEWLAKVLPNGGRIGVDPLLISASEFTRLNKEFLRNGLYLVSTPQNLVDVVWGMEQPPRPKNEIFPLHMQYTGKTWEEKIRDVRSALQKNNVDLLVLAALDDIAWLFNLRGSDICFCPVFFGYAMISNSFISLFVDGEKLTASCHDHLNSTAADCRLQILPYEDALKCLNSYTLDNPSWKVWFPPDTSYAFVSSVSEDRRLEKQSPVLVAKAVKNQVELAGLRNAHVKDAVAHCQFLCWIENEILTNACATEVSVANKFEKIRQEQQDYVSLSFDTISATGLNASVVHYLPQKHPEVRIDSDSLYLVDSGAQYKDGTTDVTRTVMFDKATEFQKQCYTRVLKGHIALATLVFPEDTPGFRLDAIARVALWEVGLNYMHGTGHGVGHFLFVHEGPVGFNIAAREGINTEGLKEANVITIEPGYYQDEEFGIRIENVYEVVRVKTENNYRDIPYLSFKAMTLVPIQTKLLVPEMLTPKEYHARCMDVVGKALEDQGRTDVLTWLREQTKPIG